MKYLFKNGTVVSGRGTRRADVLVENEKILQVGRNLSDPLARAIDVTGKLLMPGFIDAHTHFDLDVCNTTTLMTLTAAPSLPSGAAPPPLWILPAPTRANLSTTAWICGTGRPTASAGATTASI